MVSKTHLLSFSVALFACMVQKAVSVPAIIPALPAVDSLPVSGPNSNLLAKLPGAVPPLAVRSNGEVKRQERGHPYMNSGATMGGTGGGFGNGNSGGTWEAGSKKSDEPEEDEGEVGVEDRHAGHHEENEHGGKAAYTIPLNSTGPAASSAIPNPSPAPAITTSYPPPALVTQTSGAKAKFYTPKFAFPLAIAMLCAAHASSFTRSIALRFQEKVESQKNGRGYQEIAL